MFVADQQCQFETVTTASSGFAHCVFQVKPNCGRLIDVGGRSRTHACGEKNKICTVCKETVVENLGCAGCADEVGVFIYWSIYCMSKILLRGLRLRARMGRLILSGMPCHMS